MVQNAGEAERHLDYALKNSSIDDPTESVWKTVQLPKSWTCQGFDFPIYSNITQPWQAKYDSNVPVPQAPTNYNPVGIYKKKFTPDSAMLAGGRHTYIEFDGVESAYYVYLNGNAVGYSEDSFSPHRFDITSYLKEGENDLVVEVHKFCDGTWFEDQDMIYDGGIFRDVFLVSAPDVEIRDYTVHTDVNTSQNSSSLTIDLDIRNRTGNDRSGWKVKAEAFDEDGVNILGDNTAAAFSVKAMSSGTAKIETVVNDPKFWSAEHPDIYALVLTLIDDSGNEQAPPRKGDTHQTNHHYPENPIADNHGDDATAILIGPAFYRGQHHGRYHQERTAEYGSKQGQDGSKDGNDDFRTMLPLQYLTQHATKKNQVAGSLYQRKIRQRNQRMLLNPAIGTAHCLVGIRQGIIHHAIDYCKSRCG